MVREVKNLRVRLDSLAQLVKGLNPGYHYNVDEVFSVDRGTSKVFIDDNSPQIVKATDSLYLAKAWLGKVLQQLGEDSPYANDGKRKTVEDIEPTADQNRGFLHEPKEDESPWKSKSHIEKADWLRQEIQKIIPIVQNMWDNPEFDIWGDEAVVHTVHHLSEARFWMGFELSRIREDDRK